MITPPPRTEHVADAPLAYEVPAPLRAGIAMTLGVVGLRLLAVYFLVLGAIGLPQMVYMSVAMIRSSGPSTPPSDYIFVLASVNAMHWCVAFWLLAKAPKLSERLFGRVPGDTGDPATPKQIATLLVAAVGVFTFVSSLPTVVTTIGSLLTGQLSVNFTGRTTAAALLNATKGSTLLGAFMQPFIGAYLMFRADRFARLGRLYFAKNANGL